MTRANSKEVASSGCAAAGEGDAAIAPHTAVQVVSDLADLERLAPEWQALWQRCPDARVFQRPEWLVPWHRHLGPTAARVLVIRSGDRLVGLVPLTSYRRQHERALGLLGGGVSDVLDALVDPEHDDAVAAALQRDLARALDPWDVLDLERLPGVSPLLRLPLPRTESEVSLQVACPILRLPSCAADLRDVVSRRLLAAVDDAWRRLSRTAQVTLERVSADEVAPTLDELWRLVRARGRCPGQRPGLETAAVQRFHADAASAFGPAGHLRLHVLRVDGRVVGVLYALRERRRVTIYVSAHDPALDAFVPADLLVRAAIEDAIGSGATHVDFLAGRAPYKYRWGGRDEPLYRRIVRHAGSAINGAHAA